MDSVVGRLEVSLWLPLSLEEVCDKTAEGWGRRLPYPPADPQLPGVLWAEGVVEAAILQKWQQRQTGWWRRWSLCSDHTVLLPVSRPWLSALLGDACVPAARPQSSLYQVTRWGEGIPSGSSC